MIVVDASVWIDHFNDRRSPHTALLRKLIGNDATIGVVDVCLTEILQGFRRDRDVDLVSVSLLSFPILAVESVRDHLDAALLYRTARRRGHSVRSTVDCLIAAVCIRNGAALLHCDRDFDHLAAVSPLETISP